MDDRLRQRAYYERTAEHYESMHVSGNDEHGVALAFFAGLARKLDAQSVLDIGAGTGRANVVSIAGVSGCPTPNAHAINCQRRACIAIHLV